MPYPMLLIAFLETLRLSWSLFLDHFSLFPLFIQAWGAYFHAINVLFLDLLAIQFAVFILALLSRRHRFVLGGVAAGGAIISAHLVYQQFITYTPFEGYLPFILALVAFTCGLATCVYLFFSVELEHRAGRKVRLVVGGGALLVGGFTLVAHHTVFPGQYPSLHVSLLGLAVVSTLWGFYLVGWASAKSLRRTRPVTIGMVFGTVVLLGALTVGAESSMPSRIEPYLSTSEVMGEAKHHQVHWSQARPELACQTEVDAFSAQEAVETFFEYSGFPRLEEEIRLDELNVLLIMVEATRFDDTNLFSGQSRQITPRLEELSERGAFNFVNAQAPSSNTLQSTSAVMTRANPSLGPLTILSGQTSRGELRQEPFTSQAAITIAQLFQRMGHDTFRSVHHEVRSPVRGGFERGFETDLSPVVSEANEDALGVDAQITGAALDALDQYSREDGPFFGWLFYWSPHDPYTLRDKGGDRSARGRYRQEIRYVDEQIGRVLDRLEANGLLDDTIVIITSDHGEEFGDHGRTRHSKTLHKESVHVPLLISIPSMNGWTVEEPTSLSFIFTWLMLHAESGPSEQVIAHLRQTVAPSLVAAEGAVVSELLAEDGGKVSLMDADYKFIHHIGSARTEAFNLREDPLEQRDLFLSASQEVEAGVERTERYLRFRACNEQVRVQ